MKQFNKYGVAVAVAAVAAAANAAPTVSTNEVGDLAIVPYYTVEGGKNTGVHIINTSASTQVVKFRMRRGADSKDALDFNVVLSPQDEWTASIQAGGTTGVQVVTADTSCTVPAFTNGVAQMPSTYAAGATEGYIEVIGMGQTTDEEQPIAIAAKHAKGVPADCAAVRQNFYRVADADAGDAEVRGVHYSDLTSNGLCSQSAITNAATGAVCSGATTGGNASNFVGADDALKVSYFVRDADGGLEFGDNAVMIAGFSDDAMLTNQQPLLFNAAGFLTYDPLNFELPNLGFGAYSSTVDRTGAVAALTDGSLWTGLRGALGTDAIANDWSDKALADATVNTDWIVTLPGQYLMQDNFCAAYDNYAEATAGCAPTSAAAKDLVSLDEDELPLVVATTSSTAADTSNISIWDREEGVLRGEDAIEVPDQDLGFSPGGSAIDPTVTGEALLQREVNVIVWSQDAASMGVLDSAELQSEDLGLRTVLAVPGDATNGWARLSIRPKNTSPEIFVPGSLATGDVVTPALGGTRGYGAFQSTVTGDTPVVGFTVWQRNFGANASANYGRAIEHSKVATPSS